VGHAERARSALAAPVSTQRPRAPRLPRTSDRRPLPRAPGRVPASPPSRQERSNRPPCGGPRRPCARPRMPVRRRGARQRRPRPDYRPRRRRRDAAIPRPRSTVRQPPRRCEHDARPSRQLCDRPNHPPPGDAQRSARARMPGRKPFRHHRGPPVQHTSVVHRRLRPEIPPRPPCPTVIAFSVQE
jgi:hypothetical protein